MPFTTCWSTASRWITKPKTGAWSAGGSIVVDFENIENNDWLVVNQYTVEASHQNGKVNRRPDVVIFVNGLPLAVIELKNAADENATIWSAFNQLQTYKNDIPALFHYNELLIISDGLNARIGSLTANKEWFLPWKTIEGETTAPASVTQLEVLLRGVFEKRRFLDLIRYFIVFEQERGAPTLKKIAGYHQFHAVNYALEETIRASNARELAVQELKGRYLSQPLKGGETGDHRIGVVWHTQGSGKSLTMAFYTGRLVLHPAMQNPTIVVITDRNDLDDQLFGTFSRCSEILRQTPEQATSREDLQEKLKGRIAGGVFFTTIQKFMPPSALGSGRAVASSPTATTSSSSPTKPTAASMTSSTATPVTCATPCPTPPSSALPAHPSNIRTPTPGPCSAITSASTISSRRSKTAPRSRSITKAASPSWNWTKTRRPKIDPEFDEVTEGEELEKKEKLKTKWAALEAIVGTEKRIGLIAKDFVDHFEKRLEAMEGKAMIVCMSRRICVDLYNAIIKLRPEWHSDDDKQGVIKIVMTGNATDPLDWQPHVRTKARREELAKRFKDPR